MDGDKFLIFKLNNLKNLLSSETLNLKDIKKEINSIDDFYKKENYNYLDDLLYPESRKNVKIPSKVPIPSCTFQLHNCVTIPTNPYGCFLLRCNPFFLAQKSIIGSRFVSVTKTGPITSYETTFITEPISSLQMAPLEAGITGDNDAPVYTWTPLDIGQVLENDIYCQYRLVSASLSIKYIGQIKAARGVIGGGIIFKNEDVISMGSRTYFGNNPIDVDPGTGNVFMTGNRLLPEDGHFDPIRDSFYSCENNCLSGIRMLYFPIDNKYLEFCHLLNKQNQLYMDDDKYSFRYCANPGVQNNGFWWYIYGQDLPPNSSDFKLDIYFNFECLPNSKVLNYIPISLRWFSISDKQREECLKEIKNHCITKLIK